MAKRGREASTEEDSTSRDQCSSIDRISMLPDKLLVCILSFLTLKEATATSILSCRWRYLWTFYPKLDFDGSESLFKVEKRESQIDEEIGKYVGWVNHVIKSHKASTIEEFRVYFILNKSHQRDIDQWLTYALARKVQRLELNLRTTSDYTSLSNLMYYGHYSFPDELLRSWSMGQCDSIDLNYLKKIIMYNVNVNGEALELFLCNCPLLEHLSVTLSEELSSLRVIGPFPSFKCLEITFCYNLISVEIRDANLVYLKYQGKRIHFLLENVPVLVEIYFCLTSSSCMEDVVPLFSSCLPQLEIFTIDSFGTLHWREALNFYSTVKMSNLKQLAVKVFLDSNSLQALTNLIRASPCLPRFVVQPHGICETVKRKFKKIARTYTCLKEVEFLGYRGSQYELELVIHFLENAVGLEKIIIDPRQPCTSPMYKRKETRKETIEEEIAARICAREQLIEKVPPRINLEIL